MMSKLAVVIGVLNRHSIAWSCVETFIENGYDCLLTYQNKSHASKMEKLTDSLPSTGGGKILGSIACDVTADLPRLFEEQIPQALGDSRKINCVVHSVAHARNIERPIKETTLEDYLHAHHVSAYSFIETVRCSQRMMHPEQASYVTLSYLGAQRAVPGYGIMGPTKASLEALVRGLAVENGPNIRCNAVSAGPLRTAAARGIPNFGLLQKHVADTNALRRSVTAPEVASTVLFLSEATGITGQVICVDGGYSTMVPASV